MTSIILVLLVTPITEKKHFEIMQYCLSSVSNVSQTLKRKRSNIVKHEPKSTSFSSFFFISTSFSSLNPSDIAETHSSVLNISVIRNMGVTTDLIVKESTEGIKPWTSLLIVMWCLCKIFNFNLRRGSWLGMLNWIWTWKSSLSHPNYLVKKTSQQ